MDIGRILPGNEYDAAVGANAPSSSNVFATMADLIPDTDTNIYTVDGAIPATTTRTVTVPSDSTVQFAGGRTQRTYTAGGVSVIEGAGFYATGLFDTGQAAYTTVADRWMYDGSYEYLGETYIDKSVNDTTKGDQTRFFMGTNWGTANASTYGQLAWTKGQATNGFAANEFGERLLSQSAALNFINPLPITSGLAFLSGVGGGTGYFGATNQAGFASWIGTTLDQTLAEVLATGNITGANDIIVSDSQEINFNNAGVRIYKDAGGTLFLEGLPKGVVNTVTDGKTTLNGTGFIWENTTNSVTVKIGTAATQPFIQFGNGTGFSHTLQTPIITANRSATLQDASGTLAYLTDIPSAQNLASVLTVGNITGGTDMIVTRLDTLSFPIGPGGNVSMVESGSTFLMQATGPTNIHIEASTLGTIILEGAGGLNKGAVRLSENGTIFTTLRLLNTANRNIFVPDANGTVALTTDWETGATYTETNVVVDRSYDADSSSVDELADILGTLIADLRSVNIIQ